MKINKSHRIQLDSGHVDTVASYGVLGRLLSTTLIQNGHNSVINASLMGGHKPYHDGKHSVYPQRQQSGSVVSSASSNAVYTIENPALNISIINPRMLDLNIFKRYPNWIAWTPSETDEMMPMDVGVLEHSTAIWGMSKFVTECIKRAMPHKNNIFYVPCMIDDDFNPLKKSVARHAMTNIALKATHLGKTLNPNMQEYKEVRLKQWELDNAFIFGMVGANSKDFSRKGFYQAIEVFSLVLRQIPNAYLYLHTSCNQGETWWTLAQQRGVADRIFAPHPNLYDLNFFTPKDLALMFSGLDAMVTTSWGEGFGLPFVEAQACGIPFIGLGHSSITEHTNPDLLVRVNENWMSVAPQHEGKRWWSQINIKAVARKWVAFAQMPASKRDKYADLAYHYGQSFKGNHVYVNYIAPFFEAFDFNDAETTDFKLREIMDGWIADAHIEKP